MWVIQRTHDQLAGLPADERPALHPDRSIIVPAMADYVRFTGKQIAMPTVWFDQGREYLRDGRQLLLALRLAGRTGLVSCLWQGAPNVAAPPGAEKLSAALEERLGSGARMVTFDSPPDAAQRDLLHAAWVVPSRLVGDSSWGWEEQAEASLPDWLTWLRALARLLPRLPTVVAVNGRRPAIPPPD